MKTLKGLLLMTCAALALIALAGAGSASATVLCKSAPLTHVCPESDRYPVGTPVEFKLTGTLKMNAGFGTIGCSEGSIKGSISSAGGEGQSVSFENSRFELVESSCNCPTHTYNAGRMTINWSEGTNDGTLEVKNLEIEVGPCFGDTCIYGGLFSYHSTLRGGSRALWDMEETPVPLVKQENAIFIPCASPERWTSRFEMVSPYPAYVEQK
jgi:hypothetical protein